MFKKLNAEQGVTIVIITHDDHIAESTNRLVRLIDGKIVEDRKV
jgi:putative ABC transport system ATP-binding protein